MKIDEFFAEFLAIPADLEGHTISDLWNLFPARISLPKKNSKKQELIDCLGDFRDKARRFCDLYRDQFNLYELGAVVVAKDGDIQIYVIADIEMSWWDGEPDPSIHLCEIRLVKSSAFRPVNQEALHFRRHSVSWKRFAERYCITQVDFVNPEWAARIKPLLQSLVSQMPDVAHED